MMPVHCAIYHCFLMLNEHKMKMLDELIQKIILQMEIVNTIVQKIYVIKQVIDLENFTD